MNAPARLTKINNIGVHEVKFSDRIRSCEDVLLVEKYHLAILACDGGRERHNTVMVRRSYHHGVRKIGG